MIVQNITVVHKNEQIECSLELTQPLADLLSYICQEHLHIQKPELYALRLVDTDELITNENVRRKVNTGDKLKLVSSPAIEAEEIIKSLVSTDEKTLKKTIFSLQKYLEEVEFADEFFARGGVQSLANIISNASGNTLAYALTSMQNLMEHDHGWENLSPQFIDKLVSILVKQTLVNICRPATAVLIRLVCADKSNQTAAIKCYGFAVIRAALLSPELNFLPTLVQRLSTSDNILQLNSLRLINSLLRYVTEAHREEFVQMLDSLNVRKAILRLMQANPVDELVKYVVEYQHVLISYYYHKKRTLITNEEGHQAMLEEIWSAANIQADKANKWRKLGFATEFPKKELGRVGLLGLETMLALVRINKDWFTRTINEQLTKPADRRCPFARTVIEVVELLGDFWDINTGCRFTVPLTTEPQTLFFNLRSDCQKCGITLSKCADC